MHKVVEEDWSFFNQAVRDRAAGKPKAAVPPLKLVTPDAPHADGAAPVRPPVPPVPPVPPEPPQPKRTTLGAAPLGSTPVQLLGWDHDAIRFVLRLLFGIIVVIGFIWLLQNGWRNTPVVGVVTGTGTGNTTGVATGTGTGTGTGNTTPVGTGTGTEAVVTNYTQFNTVQYGDWNVVTGWVYARNGDALPMHQYCYIDTNTGQGRARYDLESRAVDGARTALKRPEALIPGLSDEVWDGALGKCRWHH